MSVSARTLRLVPVALRQLVVGRVVDVTSGMKKDHALGRPVGKVHLTRGDHSPLLLHRGSMTISVCCSLIRVRSSLCCL